MKCPLIDSIVMKNHLFENCSRVDGQIVTWWSRLWLWRAPLNGVSCPEFSYLDIAAFTSCFLLQNFHKCSQDTAVLGGWQAGRARTTWLLTRTGQQGAYASCPATSSALGGSIWRLVLMSPTIPLAPISLYVRTLHPSRRTVSEPAALTVWYCHVGCKRGPEVVALLACPLWNAWLR